MASRGSPFTLSVLDVPDLIAVSLGWRYAFSLVIPFSALTLLLSVRLRPVPKVPDVKVDGVGALLVIVPVGRLPGYVRGIGTRE